MKKLDSKERWFYLAPLSALVLACFGVIYESSPLTNSGDYLSLHAPYKQFIKDALYSGQWPLWNPYQSLGRPFIGDIESGLFYPSTLFFLLLPHSAALFCAIFLHFWAALHFIKKLFLHFESTEKAAYLIGIAYLFSVPIQSKLIHGHLHVIQSLCLLPALFYATAHMQDFNKKPGILYLALAISLLFLSGHPQTTWTLLLASMLFLLGRCEGNSFKDYMSHTFASSLRYSLSCLLAFGLSAVQALPFWDFLKHSHRQDSTWTASIYPFSLENFSSFFVPLKSTYWNYHEASFYFGLFYLLTALLGLQFCRDKNVRGFVFVICGGLLIGTSPSTPIFEIFFEFLPGYSRLHHQSRNGLIIAFSLLMLSGYWLGRSRTLKMNGVLNLLVFLGASITLVCLPDTSHTNVLRIILALCNAALVFLWALQTRFSAIRAHLYSLTFALLVLDLGLANLASKSHYEEPAKTQQEHALEQFLRQHHQYEPNGVPPRASIPAMQIRENSGMSLKYSSYNAFAGLQPARVWDYLHGMTYLDTLQFESSRVDGRIFKQGAFPMPGLSINVGLDPKAAKLVIASDPEPRVFSTNNWLFVKDHMDAIEQIRSGHPLFKQPILEEEFKQAVTIDKKVELQCQPKIDSFKLNSVTVLPQCDRAHLLVLSEAWHPGWRVEFSGKISQTIPVNVWMRGAIIPANTSAVTFSFKSKPLMYGVLLSLLSGLIFCALLFKSRKNPK